MRRFPAGRWGLFAATAILTAGLLLSCPNGVAPEIDVPVDEEETTPDDPGLPTFDPATDTLAATGVVYDADDGLAAGKLNAPDEILLERDGERLVAAATMSKYPDGLSYLRFGDDEWLDITIPPGSDQLAGLTCDPEAVYTGAGSDILTVPSDGDTAGAISALSDGIVITALLVAGEDIFIGTTTNALMTSAEGLVSEPPAKPLPISDTAVPIHVTSFAVNKTFVYVAARSSKDGPKDGSSSGGLYSWDPAADAEVAWQTEATDLSVYDLLEFSGSLYVAAVDGLYLLSDAGALQPVTELAHPDTGQPVVHDLFADNGVIYAATSHGLWYSPGGGTAWVLLEPGDLAFDPATTTISSVTALGDRVYLGVDAYGVVELRWQ